MNVTKLFDRHNQQVVMLYVATLVGVILGFAASILNTHALDNPVAYGDVRYVQNAIQLIASLLLFGYFLSGSRLLAISDSEERSRRIRGAMITILLTCILLMFVGILLMALFHGISSSISKLFLISLPVCLYPLLTNYINTTAQGDNHIIRLSCARLLPSLFYIPIAWRIYAIWGASSSMMILLQWGVYSIILLFIVISTRPSFKQLRPIFRDLNEENRRYGLLLYWGSLAMVATNYIAGVTLGLFNSDNANVGYYTLALTVTMPLSYLPAIVGTAYFKQFAHQSSIPRSVMKGTLLMTTISCIGFIILIRPLVNLLYPAEYSQVGIYASWMSVGFSIHGIGDMINRFLGSHGIGRPILMSSIACGVVKILGFIILVYLWDINGALVTNVLSSAIYCLALWLYYKQFVSKSLHS